ncbi:hypothetical protein [Streptomyces sp. RG80]|uniref:hypothetical protein n=1 Tax=Streptomyces sp. RG80 TaxID=3157340 RepID=UPI00338F6C74
MWTATLSDVIRNFSVQLSATPRGARLARLLATEQLRSWELPFDAALVLVDALSSRWGVSEGPAPRKTVWAEVTLPPSSGNPYSGATGDLPQGPLERKDPCQAPPLLPPVRAAHPPG